MRWLALAGFLALCFLVAAVGGWLTSLGMPEWYMELRKPSWNPPAWIFGPVWTALYAAMAVAAWLVWSRAGFENAGRAMTLFFTQLALNMAWSGIFFALRSPGWALVEIFALWIAILATTALFFRHSVTAGVLMVPYLLWVGFAGVLNAAIVRLN
ncbi:MAG: TspO/MBR family protein [Longimicrobiales bacterium]|nr:TspO/MBR family protein [Longimicrobiales bacterium]